MNIVITIKMVVRVMRMLLPMPYEQQKTELLGGFQSHIRKLSIML